MIHTTGKYFNGISSKSREIDLQLDEINAEIRFSSSSNEINHWSIGDISFEYIGSSLEIRNKLHSLELIKVENDDFATELIAILKAKGHISLYQRIIQLGN